MRRLSTWAVFRPTLIDDGVGGQTATLFELSPVRGDVRQLTGREQLEAQQAGAEHTHTAFFGPRVDVQRNDELVRNTQRLKVLTVTQTFPEGPMGRLRVTARSVEAMPTPVLPEVGSFTKHTMSTDGVAASQLQQVGPYFQVTLTAGTANPTNLRDVFLQQGLSSADFHALATFDPPFFGTNFNPDIIPQHGIVLRYQTDATKQRAVAVFHNILFGLPQLLVGVWESNLDGTLFVNRQATGFPEPFGLPFPFNVECRLTGSIVDVRQWEVGDPVPSWDDPTLARVIDLEVDAGDPMVIPTPVGVGEAGFAANHLGFDTTPLSAVRYPLHSLILEAK